MNASDVSLGPAVLAHGGTAGAVLEVTFLLLPIVLFALFAWRSSRRQRREAEAEAEAGAGSPATPPSPAPPDDGS